MKGRQSGDRLVGVHVINKVKMKIEVHNCNKEPQRGKELRRMAPVGKSDQDRARAAR